MSEFIDYVWLDVLTWNMPRISWHARLLPIKPCLHTKLQKHNKSYWKVINKSGNFPMGGGIWTAFQRGEGEFKCPGGSPWGCWSFDLTGTLPSESPFGIVHCWSISSRCFHRACRPDSLKLRPQLLKMKKDIHDLKRVDFRGFKLSLTLYLKRGKRW